MEKYKNDRGLVGVLVSGGYGSGWSTWGYEDSAFLAMDKTLVEMRLRGAGEEEVETYLEGVLSEAPYMGGWDQVEVAYLEEGTAFIIEEYDGSESLRTLDDLTMVA